VEFRGGVVPSFHVARSEEDLEEDDNILMDSDEEDISDDEILTPARYETCKDNEISIEVKSGVLIVPKDMSGKMESLGIGKVEIVSEQVAIFADACVASDVDFGNGEGLYERICDESANPLNHEVLEILRDVNENNMMTQKERIVHLFTQNPSLHNFILNGLNYSGNSNKYLDDFQNFILIELERMNENLIGAIADYFDILKYYDVGEPKLNVPMMWTPILGYIESITPYVREGNSLFSNDNYDRSSKIVCYGFSGGKIDPLLKTYYSRVTFIDEKGKYHEFYDKNFKKSKIPFCSPGLFDNYERGKESVLIFNSCSRIWRTEEGNKSMTYYVSSLLRGKNPNQDKYFNVEGLRMAVRMNMPYKRNLEMFEGCYPFVVADTCSPIDLQIILIKLFDEDEGRINTHNRRLKSIKTMFVGAELKKRFRVVKDKQDFIQYLRVIRIRRIQELLGRIDVMKEWHRPYFGSHNRVWFLASSQMPYVYFDSDAFREKNNSRANVSRRGRLRN